MTTPQTLFPDFKPLQCICLDAEFASWRDILEMLELTMTDSEGKVIFNHRFRPARIRKWNLIPHGIRPSDVEREPSFASCRPSIQRILDGARYLIGFAIDNDIRRLEGQGVRRLNRPHIIEIRDWFWLIYGREAGLDYAQDIGLARCCKELGVEIDPDQAHGAAYDTAITLRCFHVLLERFVKSHADRAFASFDELYDTFAQEFGEAKKAYDLAAAHGYCTIYATETESGKGFRFAASKEAPDPERSDIVATIEVANRRKAILDLSKLLTGQALSSNRFYFSRLPQERLRRFKEYTNAADIDELNHAKNLLRLASAFNSHR